MIYYILLYLNVFLMLTCFANVYMFYVVIYLKEDQYCFGALSVLSKNFFFRRWLNQKHEPVFQRHKCLHIAFKREKFYFPKTCTASWHTAKATKEGLNVNNTYYIKFLHKIPFRSFDIMPIFLIMLGNNW